MNKRGIQPAELSDATALGYSHGVEIDNVLYVSGQVSHANGLEAQVAEAWANVVRVVEESGAIPSSIVKLGVFTRDEQAWSFLQPLIEASMSPPYPASTMLTVVGLAHPDFLVEIEAVAHLTEPRTSSS